MLRRRAARAYLLADKPDSAIEASYEADRLSTAARRGAEGSQLEVALLGDAETQLIRGDALLLKDQPADATAAFEAGLEILQQTSSELPEAMPIRFELHCRLARERLKQKPPRREEAAQHAQEAAEASPGHVFLTRFFPDLVEAVLANYNPEAVVRFVEVAFSPSKRGMTKLASGRVLQWLKQARRLCEALTAAHDDRRERNAMATILVAAARVASGEIHRVVRPQRARHPDWPKVVSELLLLHEIGAAADVNPEILQTVLNLASLQPRPSRKASEA